jgi:hypothetical protein
MQVKEGASWATLEYLKWSQSSSNPKGPPPKIIVAGITYTQKSKYRSKVIVECASFLSNGPIFINLFKDLANLSKSKI